MATRLNDNTKTTRDSNNNNIENEFDAEITQLTPSFIKDQIDAESNKITEEIKELGSKKIEEDNNKDDGEDNNETDDDSPNFRDKDKELKESIKSQLSPESQNVINMNDDEFNAIIEQLKKRGLSNDKGIELQKIRNITHGRNGINR